MLYIDIMISSLRKFFRELNNSIILEGNPLKHVSKDAFHKRNIYILDFIGKFIVAALLLYGIFSILNKNYTHGILNFGAVLLMVLFLIYLKKYKNYPRAVRMMIIFCLLFSLYLFQVETEGDGLFLWTLTAPMFLIFFLKIREGTILAVIYLVINLAVTALNFFNTGYTLRFLVRYSGVYLTLVIMSFIYGRIQEEATVGLIRTNSKLNQTILNLSEAEKDLSRSEEQYRALVENSNEGIGILQEFRFIYVNTKICTMSGFSREELLNKSLHQVLISENKQLLQRLFNKETWSGLPRDRVELNLLTRSGDQIEVEVGTNSVEYEGMESQLIFIKDVRERNLIEKEKSKLANLESFRIVANGMTHDFNNILTIILGNLELIRISGKDNPRIDKATLKIEEASRRASELLDDLYIFSTSSVKEESLEQIREIIDSVTHVLKTDFGGGNFSLRYELELPDLRCDRKQIGIALKNILLNSVDATRGGSDIEVTVSGFSNHAGLIRPLKKGDFLKITIKDSGKGIPRENIGKIFDPYFSTKMNVTEKGIGLGLAIANKIVLDHLGLITVESKEGKGTTFTIYLPAETGGKKGVII